MELETRATPLENGKGWRDHLGFAGPFRPGVGPRSDPKGEHPTGPDIGERLPPILAPDQNGRIVACDEDSCRILNGHADLLELGEQSWLMSSNSARESQNPASTVFGTI